MNAKAIRQKAAKKMYVPQVMVSSMLGVTRPMILERIRLVDLKWDKEQRGQSFATFAGSTADTHKLHIQVADVVMEMALDRIDRLKISDGRTQPMGA